MNILDHYPYFESNQVLTHSQLNELFEYLDDQSRLTRCKLIGIGIVCGLDVSAPATNGDGVSVPIKISGGIGITSEGYAITIDDTYPGYYRNYQLPEGEPYAAFTEEGTDSQLELFELIVTDDPVESTDTAIDDNFLEDKVIIVFLEMYKYDPRSCLVRSCDEIGQTTYIKTRILAATTEVAEQIRNKTATGSTSEDIFEERFNLETVALQRVLFAPGNFNGSTDNLQVIYEKYRDAIKEVQPGLVSALQDTYSVYKPLLLPVYGEDPFASSGITGIIASWSDYLSTENSTQDYFGMHYFYDFIKDLILAYDEFRLTAFDVVRKCNINTALFPRHLFLGEAYPDISDHDPQLNRNTFIQPYIYKNLTENIEKIKSLHQRIVQAILNFSFDFIANPDNGLSLKITPSKEKGTLLSERSIPFYYDIENEGSKLLETWNYDLTRRRLSDENLSYHAENYATGKEYITDPLNYDYDKYQFLRIEGVNSATADSLIAELENLKATYNLPFNVRSIYLNQDAENINITDYNLWKDLQTEYVGIRDKNICQIQKLISCLKVPAGDGYADELTALIEKINKAYDAIIEVLPFELNQVNISEVLKQMNNLYESLIEFILYIKHLFGKLISELYPVLTSQEFHERKQELNDIYYCIKNFLSGCQLYSLTTIIYRYQFRINYLKTNSTGILPNFIDKHPGLEHMAGVPKGGTYIVVHDTITVSGSETSRVVADFALPYVCCSDSLQVPSTEYESENLELPPVAMPDYYLVSSEEESVSLDVLNNDLYRENYKVEITKISGNENVTTGDDGNPLYKIPEAFTGIDKFQYSIRHIDGNSLTSKAVVKILVREPYQVYPKAIGDIDFTDITTVINIDVLKNDFYNSQTKLELVAAHSTLGAALSIVNVSGKNYIRYSPTAAGRDSFKYRLTDNWRTPVISSEGEVRVFVSKPSTGGTYSAPIIVQKNSRENQISILLETDTGAYELYVIDSDGNRVSGCNTENGKAAIQSFDEGQMILYTPNTGFFGTDKINYEIKFDNGTQRIGEVNLLVICCCIDLPEYTVPSAKPYEEYTFNINLFADVYSGLTLVSLDYFDRNIIKAILLDKNQIIILPLDDIVYNGKYTFEYYAKDGNNNCYKGKITIVPDKSKDIIPDHNVHVVSLDPIIIRLEVPDKYDWRIKSVFDFDTACGEIKITDSSRAIEYIPSNGIKDVLVETFSYTVINDHEDMLTGTINLINLVEREQSYINFVLVYSAFPLKPIADARFGSAVDILDDIAIVGAMNYPFKDLIKSGAVFLYEKQASGSWAISTDLNEMVKNAEYNLLGSSVGITSISGSGTFILLGVPGSDSQTGSVYVLQRTSPTAGWNRLPVLIPEDAVKGDMFGSKMALYDYGAVISSPGKKIADNNMGCAYIYGYKDGSWIPFQTLKASQAIANIVFGFSLDLYQRTIVVGAYNQKNATETEGGCYVFEYNETSQKYEEVQVLTAPDAESASGFGYAVSVYGNWMAVSSVNNNSQNSGKVMLYLRDKDNKWNYQLTLIAPNEIPGNKFGQSVSLYNDLLVVSAMPLEPNELSPECIHVYHLEQNIWVYKQKIINNNETTRFGVALQLHNKELIVGAESDVDGSIRTGSMSIYEQIQS